jgi:hypothetical protein
MGVLICTSSWPWTLNPPAATSQVFVLQT